MTLAFSTKFPKGKTGLEGKPTHFIEKIWTGKIIHWTPFRYVRESIEVNDEQIIKQK